ncbi:hypothetical protein JW835_05065 [bacterium]|nr:hypothetical protein [bacterium]
MIIINRIPDIIFRIFFIMVIFFLLTCQSPEKVAAHRVEVEQGFLSVLPMHEDNFCFFANIGWTSGKIFPCDHGGFLLTDVTKKVPVFCPADMTITRIMATDQGGYVDYGLTLSVNEEEFIVQFGHLSALHDDILEILEADDQAECDTLNSLGNRFIHCLSWVNIPVSAGDTLGMAGGNPGQNGLDFGTYDKTRKIEFATDRFDDYWYSYATSPLDYFTEEICQILIPICGFTLCEPNVVRIVPPVGGTIDFDIPGTAQGIWFKAGEPFSPVDPHMALVYHNVDPAIPIFSIGTGLPGLGTGGYTFTIADTGFADRPFHEVKPDGHIYHYHIWYHCSPTWYRQSVILLQLTDETHMKIERQDADAGPPWRFTADAVTYER